MGLVPTGVRARNRSCPWPATHTTLDPQGRHGAIAERRTHWKDVFRFPLRRSFQGRAATLELDPLQGALMAKHRPDVRKVFKKTRKIPSERIATFRPLSTTLVSITDTPGADLLVVCRVLGFRARGRNSFRCAAGFHTVGQQAREHGMKVVNLVWAGSGRESASCFADGLPESEIDQVWTPSANVAAAEAPGLGRVRGAFGRVRQHRKME